MMARYAVAYAMIRVAVGVATRNAKISNISSASTSNTEGKKNRNDLCKPLEKSM